MRDGLPTMTAAAILAVFFAFVAVVGYQRLKLDRAFGRLPPELREHLGLGIGGLSRRRREALADRLTIYGLPEWVPLAPEERLTLDRLRVAVLSFLALMAFGPALIFASAWGLVTLPPVLAVVGVRAVMVGRWPAAPEGLSREGQSVRRAG